VKAAGLATRTTARDRTRSVHRRARDIGANLRRRTDAAKDEVRVINRDLIRIAQQAVAEARAVARNARRSIAHPSAGASCRARAALDTLEATASRVERIAEQTRLRIAGATPDGSTRLVSLHETDARPIAKGRLGKPVEFGYKAQVVDNDDDIVLDHNVEVGNPPDAPMLAPAIERVAAHTGRAPGL
jgi:IS5 family transposase